MGVTQAQAQQDTTPVSVNPALLEILNAKYPRPFTIANIEVTGTKAFDPALIRSISGLAVGDKVLLPGSDAFSKAIAKLWKQSLVSMVNIYITKLEDQDITIEINITERPRLIDFRLLGLSKAEKDDLEPKIGLTKDRVLTENMKLSALESIRKFYYEKGYRNVDIQCQEISIEGISNGISLDFTVNKGKRVRIHSVHFTGNRLVEENKLKKQMKGTKEMGRLSLRPSTIPNPYGDTTLESYPLRDYINEYGFLSVSKTLRVLDPYFRFKFFSGSKFNEIKFDEDKEICATSTSRTMGSRWPKYHCYIFA
jgi:outer membrane protein insertion porin family